MTKNNFVLKVTFNNPMIYQKCQAMINITAYQYTRQTALYIYIYIF